MKRVTYRHMDFLLGGFLLISGVLTKLAETLLLQPILRLKCL